MVELTNGKSRETALTAPAVNGRSLANQGQFPAGEHLAVETELGEVYAAGQSFGVPRHSPGAGMRHCIQGPGHLPTARIEDPQNRLSIAWQCVVHLRAGIEGIGISSQGRCSGWGLVGARQAAVGVYDQHVIDQGLDQATPTGVLGDKPQAHLIGHGNVGQRQFEACLHPGRFGLGDDLEAGPGSAAVVGNIDEEVVVEGGGVNVPTPVADFGPVRGGQVEDGRGQGGTAAVDVLIAVASAGGEGPSPIEEPDEWSAWAGVRLSLPLWAPRRGAVAVYKRQEADEEAARYRDTVRVALRNIRQAYARRLHAEAAWRDAKAEADRQRARFDSAQRQFDQGLIALPPFEQARLVWLQADERVKALHAGTLRRHVELVKACGGPNAMDRRTRAR